MENRSLPPKAAVPVAGTGDTVGETVPGATPVAPPPPFSQPGDEASLPGSAQPPAFSLDPNATNFDGMGHDEIGDCVYDCCCAINDASNAILGQIASQLSQISTILVGVSQAITATLTAQVAEAATPITTAQYHVDDEIMTQLAGINYLLDTIGFELQSQSQEHSQGQSQTQSGSFTPPPITVDEGVYVNFQPPTIQQGDSGGVSGVGSVGINGMPGGTGGGGGSGGGGGGGGGGIGVGGGGGLGGTGGIGGTTGSGGIGEGGGGGSGGSGGGGGVAISEGGSQVGGSGGGPTNLDSNLAINVGGAVPAIGGSAVAIGKAALFPVDITKPLAFFFAPDDNGWRTRALQWYANELNDVMTFDTFNDYVKAKNQTYASPGKRSDTEQQG